MNERRTVSGLFDLGRCCDLPKGKGKERALLHPACPRARETAEILLSSFFTSYVGTWGLSHRSRARCVLRPADEPPTPAEGRFTPPPGLDASPLERDIDEDEVDVGGFCSKFSHHRRR
jgi:hypothetical protein